MRGLILIALAVSFCAARCPAEQLGYHEIQVDASGRIVPWCSPEPSVAYDRILHLVWNFWKNMGNCSNGIPYFFQHQVWKPEHDPRGLGGDQLAMALSSLDLWYDYTGDTSVRDFMVRVADYCLDRGLSNPSDAWPNLPYPYNTDVHSGFYDGDMRAGKGALQPDKAGSFGIELLRLFEKTGNHRYRDAAAAIADTLATKVARGDSEHSPWPFRVNAHTGGVPTNAFAIYTANWTGTLRLFDELVRLKSKNTSDYRAASKTVSKWLREYPLKSNQWGPFFEDVVDWSNTEINADTMAWYLLENPKWDSQGKEYARGILDWTFTTFGTNGWAKYGATPLEEQTVYRAPGNSHTARHGSAELIYCEKTADTSHKEDAIRQLNWATYMVDNDGKNRYPGDDIWLTDGYGDYVRHYLRTMAAAPELAPSGQDHLLRSSSVLRQIDYRADAIQYRTFDATSRERLRIAFEPTSVMVGGKRLQKRSAPKELEDGDGYYLEGEGPSKGLLEIRHSYVGEVVIAR